MTSKSVVFMSGKVYWAKITGAPVPNYAKDGKEWTFEFEPDKAGVELLKKHKLDDRLRIKEDPKNPDKGRFLILKKGETRADGQANLPIRIYNSEDEEWDRTQLIGNGSSVDVKLDIRDYGVGKKSGIYPVAVRVTDLVAYQSSEFGGMDDGGAKPAKVHKTVSTKSSNFDAELDDEIPV